MEMNKMAEQTVKRTQGKAIDMLNGSIFDKLLLFALPLAASSILQQLFNAVDVAVVGRFASSRAQAAVGCVGPIINLLLNIFIGISVGANVVIAKYIGQNIKDEIRRTVHTAIVVALLSGIFLLGFGQLIARPMLMWMNTPSNIIEDASLYLRIYFLGMPFILLYNFGAAILRSIGDTKRPFYCLMIAGIVNAGLNMFLVIVFHMGVAGVAIATLVSNAISSSMVLYLLMHEQGDVRLCLSELKIWKQELIQILKVGLPAGLQTSVFSIANIFIQSALNGYGSDAVAGSAVIITYECVTYFIVSAFGQATVTFTSQNYGAGQYERCKKIFRLTLPTAMFIILCVSWSFILGKSFFISLFTSEPKVIEYAEIRMVHIMMLYILIPTYEIGGAALRGIGYSMTPALITIFGTCVLRLVWIYTVCKVYTGFETLINVYPISWGVTGAAVLTTYFIIRKKVFAKS